MLLRRGLHLRALRARLVRARGDDERMPMHLLLVLAVQLRAEPNPDGRPRAPVGRVLRVTGNHPVAEGLGDLRAELLTFLERRLGSRADAEDVFHDAVVRALEYAPPSHEEALRPWLYATLKHALVDRWRRGDAAKRALEKFSSEPEAHDEALDRAVCACVAGALGSLKPEYAGALRAVELEEQAVGAWAEAAGISANAASVRLHRARAALRQKLETACGACATVAACVECTCGLAAE